MYLDEFQNELSRVMWDLDCQKRSEERALEIISSLIDDFAARFTSRADVVTYAADRIEKMHYALASKIAAAVRKWAGVIVHSGGGGGALITEGRRFIVGCEDEKTLSAEDIRSLSGVAPAPARFTYQVQGATADGGGFPAHEGLLASYKEAVDCLAKCWTQGTGWIEIRRAGEAIAMAHVCFNQGRRYKVYLFNKGERS